MTIDATGKTAKEISHKNKCLCKWNIMGSVKQSIIAINHVSKERDTTNCYQLSLKE